jgi:hypothetical protein
LSSIVLVAMLLMQLVCCLLPLDKDGPTEDLVCVV